MKKNFAKKIIGLALIVGITLGTCFPAFAISEKSVDLYSEKAIALEVNSNTILYEEDAYEQAEPASITKLVTALVVVDNLELDEVITIPELPNLAADASSIGLVEGEEMTVEELLYGMLLESGNDVANAFAIVISGNLEDFAVEMNEKVESLGATNSNFVNPSGLSESDHYSTAYDLALITIEALDNEDIATIVGTAEYEIPTTNKSGTRELTNSNLLISATEEDMVEVDDVKIDLKYEYSLGGKTGYTEEAGYCLANISECDGTKVVTVVLGAGGPNGRALDTIALCDMVFENYRTIKILDAGDKVENVKIVKGSDPKIAGTTLNGLYVTLPSEAADEIASYEVVVYDDINAPVKEGDVVGTIYTYAGQEEMGQLDLVASKDVEEGGPWTLIGISDVMFVIIVIFMILIIVTILLLRKINKKKTRERKAAVAKIRRERIEKELEIRKREERNRKDRDWPF